MSVPNPFVYDSVQVTWRTDGSVERIMYGNEPLNETVSNRLKALQLSASPLTVLLSPEFCALIDDLLNAVAALPCSETKRRIDLADLLFGHTQDIREDNGIKFFFVSNVFRVKQSP